MTHFTTSRPTSDDVAGGIPRVPARKPSSGALRGTVEWVVILAVAVLGAFLIRTFLIQAFYIPSGSMIPTLRIDDRVLVNKTSYKLHSVHRGDIVVFTHPPGSELDSKKIKDLIKRVIGLPGETIESHNGQLLINGHPLTEPYVLADGHPGPDVLRQLIPAHHYFVMGDNRGDSSDSRVFGPITHSQIVGRAFILVWPIRNIHLL